MGILLGAVGMLGFPIALIIFAIAKLRKKKKLKKHSLIAMGVTFALFVLGFSIYKPENETKITEPKQDKVVKTEKKAEASSSNKEAKKETKKEVASSSSSKEKIKSNKETVASSSEEPFDPASYPLVDFNAWNHDDVEYASKLQVTGTVIQAMKSDEGMNLRLAINDDYDQVVLITIEDSDYQDVIAEDDNVTVYGLNAGLTSYKTVMGNEQTIPAMLGTNYTVNSYGQ